MKKFICRVVTMILLFSLTLPAVPVQAAQLSDFPKVTVYLDGKRVRHPDAQPCIMSDRTMVPVYQLTRCLGAKIAWDGATRTVTMTRAGTTIKMTIDSKTAYVNGQPMEMDVAPCILEDRTMIPAAYMAIFFGQDVAWDGQTASVYVTEKKSVAGESRMEDWAIPMGYYLNSPHIAFGGYPRSDVDAYPTTPEMLLSQSWGIYSREDLIATVVNMTAGGHNLDFLAAAELVNALSPREYQELLAQSGEMDSYMWPYTKELSRKWGDRGILCWDLFRMSNLVQWGYKCGYLTYEEALVLLQPAVLLLQGNFTSWDEAYENYVDGYNWWDRNNVLGQDTMDTPRGRHYRTYREQYGAQVFDNELFRQELVPVPGLTLEELLDSVGLG